MQTAVTFKLGGLHPDLTNLFCNINYYHRNSLSLAVNRLGSVEILISKGRRKIVAHYGRFKVCRISRPYVN